MSKKKLFKDTGLSYDQKFLSSDNPGQSIWNKIEKSIKIRQDLQVSISNANLNVKFTQNKGGIRGVLEN